MANSAEAEDPSQHAAAGTATPARRKHETVDAFGVPPLVKYTRRTELTEELRRWYAINDTVNVDDIVEVDHVWGDQTLAECVGATGAYDYLVASHVIEHVPDLKALPARFSIAMARSACARVAAGL